MKVAIVGGGPSGLYLAILLMKAGGHDVTVLERNPPDATFGWGVVFSEETLGRLRDADEPSYRAIGEAFATLDDDRRPLPRRARCARTATASAPSAARRCSAILQERARELGAELRFQHEVIASSRRPTS